MRTRQCTQCLTVFPETLEHFYFQRTRNRFDSVCKRCRGVQAKEWVQGNREKAREYTRRWRRDNLNMARAQNAAQQRRRRVEKATVISAQRKARRLANLDEARRKHRAHYAEHREEITQRIRSDRVANPEKYRVPVRARRQKPEVAERIRAQSRVWYAKNSAKAYAKVKAWAQANPERVAEHHRKRRACKANAPTNDFTASQWISLQIAFNHRCAYCGRRCKGRLTQDHVTPLSKGGAHTAANIVPACKSCNSKKHTGPPLRPIQLPLIT